MADIVTCTPHALMHDWHCLECLSVTDLKAVIAVLLCYAAAGRGADCSAETLIDDGKCFACLSEKQLLQAIASILITYTYESGDLPISTDAVIDAAACLRCADPRTVEAVIVQRFCAWVNHVFVAPQN